MDYGINLDLHQLEKDIHPIIDSTINFGTKLLIAALLLTAGIWISNRASAAIRKATEHRKVDPSLRTFLISLFNIVSKVLVVVIVLATVGIEMTSIIAVLGAASLAVGMALSGTLQNFAGGVVILLFKPFKVGDLIETEKGDMGYVMSIMIFTTQIRTFENKLVYMPNGHLANENITNHSQMGARRVEVKVGISYGDSVEKVREIILDMLNNDLRVHKTPAPFVAVDDLAASSVNLVVRFWTDFANLYTLQYEYRERIYTAFPKHGHHFPFPQMDVHIKQPQDSK